METRTEEMENKKLYVFVSHAGNFPYAYSLYALDIPSPGTIVTPITTTVTTTTTTTINGNMVDTTTDSTSCTEPQRSPVEPVLRFCWSDWPLHIFMNCTRLKSKLYFIGGTTGSGRLSKEVYALDLSQEIPSTMRDRSREVLKQVPSMITGKGSPFYSFVADGKIFVVSGPSLNGLDITQFEIFDPEAGPEGAWTTTRPEHRPPFQDVSYDVCPLVVGRRAFFVGSRQNKNSFGRNMEEFICCYDIDTGTWSDNNCMEGFFGYSSEDLGMGYAPHPGAEVVGETLWKVQPHPETGLPIVVRLDITNNKVRKEKKFFDVVKYHNNEKNYSDEWITRGGILKCLGVGDSPNSSRLCFLEFESSVILNSMSVTVFDVDHNGDSAEYVASAHYYADLEDCHAAFKVSDANVV